MARINQQIIAQRLKMSQTTVSRALANHPAINAATKALVWDLAAKLGYQIPPPRARLSNSGEPNVIGVLIAIPARQRGRAETSQEVLRGVAERSSTDVVTLDVLYQEPADHNARSLQRRLRQSRWRGAILVHPMAEDVVDIISKTVPTVSVIENYRRNHIDSVDVDQIEAISALVQRLYKRGHRKIGFLTWAYDVPTPWVHHRFGSYVETLFRLGLEFDENRVFNVRHGEHLEAKLVADSAVRAIESGTSAFVCAADHQAYEMCQLLAERGIRVPDDCSLTGFDGLEPPSGQLPVATVRVPYDELGRSAFHQLMRRVDHPLGPRRHVVVDGELIEGTSISNLLLTTA